MTHWVNTHIENSGAFSVCYKKNSLRAKSSHKEHLFQQHDFPFNVYTSVANTNSKEQELLMDQDIINP